MNLEGLRYTTADDYAKCKMDQENQEMVTFLEKWNVLKKGKYVL